jgi:hypothetical protein
MTEYQFDPIKLEIFKHMFAAIPEEMGAVLQKSSYSPNIKERRDFSCALFDAEGNMIAQAAHIPVHLGAMPLSVQQSIQTLPLNPGDIMILNDPYRGGTHLPDITLVSPIFVEGALFGFAANRAQPMCALPQSAQATYKRSWPQTNAGFNGRWNWLPDMEKPNFRHTAVTCWPIPSG